nr:PspC domain-containing protein [Acidimicrobiia bacterium]
MGSRPRQGDDEDMADDTKQSLRRSADDRIISGVAGGIGSLAGVNSVSIRVGFILLTFVGGAGLWLYFLGWLCLPHRDGSPSILANTLRGDSPHQIRSMAGTLLLLAATAISMFLLGPPLLDLLTMFLTSGAVVIVLLAVALIAAGAWLIWRPKASDPPPLRSGPPPQEAASSPVAAAAAAPTRDVTAPTGPADSPGGERLAPTGRRRGRIKARTRRGPPPPPRRPPARPPPGRRRGRIRARTRRASAPRWRRSRRQRRRRERSFLGPIASAAMLIVVGGVVILDRFEVFDTDPTLLVAVLVLIVGAVLVMSAFLGRAHGLILVGALLSAVLVVGTAADIRSVWSGIGTERVEATNLGELEDEYRHGIGKLVVDLREVDFNGQSTTLNLGLTIGELLI